MTQDHTLRKTFAIVLAACFTTLAGAAFAGSDTPGQTDQKVDCKKMPSHPDCKDKTQ
jgi:hypothetical protein